MITTDDLRINYTVEDYSDDTNLNQPTQDLLDQIRDGYFINDNMKNIRTEMRKFSSSVLSGVFQEHSCIFKS